MPLFSILLFSFSLKNFCLFFNSTHKCKVYTYMPGKLKYNLPIAKVAHNQCTMISDDVFLWGDVLAVKNHVYTFQFHVKY